MIAYKHKLTSTIDLFQVQNVRDKLGNVWFHVEYLDTDDVVRYCRFKSLTSALDFIDSNFNSK